MQARADMEANLSAASEREADRRAAESRLQEEATMLRRALGESITVGLAQLVASVVHAHQRGIMHTSNTVPIPALPQNMHLQPEWCNSETDKNSKHFLSTPQRRA